MSSEPRADGLFGLSREEERAIGSDRATRLRAVRALLLTAQLLRNELDRMLSADGLTTQQAALLTVIRALGRPSFAEAASALGTTHQNVKQLAVVLERKGFLTIARDPKDGRVRRLATTARNRRYWARRDPSDHDEVMGFFVDLNASDARQLLELLLRIIRRIARATEGRPERSKFRRSLWRNKIARKPRAS